VLTAILKKEGDMPASIAHMLISRSVRTQLTEDSTVSKQFVEILNSHATCMELGSLGPDLPYYESMMKGALDIILKRSDKPMGVDQWSYQLHSKDPNLFPLKMIEITWKETALEKEEWDEDDHGKFAFICGYLTHVAADQIIHPIVNLIAGPYYKRGDSREKHRDCEVHQDVFLFNNRFPDADLTTTKFNTWCDIASGFESNAPIWLRYLLQKSFVEAHAVMPPENSIENWIDGILTVLRVMDTFGPYTAAYKALKAGDMSGFEEYINFKRTSDSSKELTDTYSRMIGNYTYLDFFQKATDLAKIYVKAAHKIYQAEAIDDGVRKNFLGVVRNADLSAPLEDDISNKAQKALDSWQ
jgi:hypothetical protein